MSRCASLPLGRCLSQCITRPLSLTSYHRVKGSRDCCQRTARGQREGPTRPRLCVYVNALQRQIVQKAKLDLYCDLQALLISPPSALPPGHRTHYSVEELNGPHIRYYLSLRGGARGHDVHVRVHHRRFLLPSKRLCLPDSLGSGGVSRLMAAHSRAR